MEHKINFWIENKTGEKLVGEKHHDTRQRVSQAGSAHESSMQRLVCEEHHRLRETGDTIHL